MNLLMASMLHAGRIQIIVMIRQILVFISLILIIVGVIITLVVGVVDEISFLMLLVVFSFIQPTHFAVWAFFIFLVVIFIVIVAFILTFIELIILLIIFSIEFSITTANLFTSINLLTWSKVTVILIHLRRLIVAHLRMVNCQVISVLVVLRLHARTSFRSTFHPYALIVVHHPHISMYFIMLVIVDQLLLFALIYVTNRTDRPLHASTFSIITKGLVVHLLLVTVLTHVKATFTSHRLLTVTRSTFIVRHWLLVLTIMWQLILVKGLLIKIIVLLRYALILCIILLYLVHTESTCCVITVFNPAAAAIFVLKSNFCLYLALTVSSFSGWARRSRSWAIMWLLLLLLLGHNSGIGRSLLLHWSLLHMRLLWCILRDILAM